MHYRFSDRRAFACWQALQVQVGPQVQMSPHWHEAAGRGAGFWQPQVHCAPTHVPHAQTFDWLVMRSSFSVLTSCQRKGVSHPGPLAGLDGAADVVERIGYSRARELTPAGTWPQRVER